MAWIFGSGLYGTQCNLSNSKRSLWAQVICFLCLEGMILLTTRKNVSFHFIVTGTVSVYLSDPSKPTMPDSHRYP